MCILVLHGGRNSPCRSSALRTVGVRQRAYHCWDPQMIYQYCCYLLLVSRGEDPVVECLLLFVGCIRKGLVTSCLLLGVGSIMRPVARLYPLDFGYTCAISSRRGTNS